MRNMINKILHVQEIYSLLPSYGEKKKRYIQITPGTSLKFKIQNIHYDYLPVDTSVVAFVIYKAVVVLRKAVVF